jgi:hypothetical protein
MDIGKVVGITFWDILGAARSRSDPIGRQGRVLLPR